ncbi:MAG: hypothetical protein Q7S66_04750 [bacterium]|nr:hypothetical protein [bacterium]
MEIKIKFRDFKKVPFVEGEKSESEEKKILNLLNEDGGGVDGGYMPLEELLRHLRERHFGETVHVVFEVKSGPTNGSGYGHIDYTVTSDGVPADIYTNALIGAH